MPTGLLRATNKEVVLEVHNDDGHIERFVVSDFTFVDSRKNVLIITKDSNTTKSGTLGKLAAKKKKKKNASK
jgi:hypothetical protein